jgi:hypothetical protein
MDKDYQGLRGLDRYQMHESPRESSMMTIAILSPPFSPYFHMSLGNGSVLDIFMREPCAKRAPAYIYASETSMVDRGREAQLHQLEGLFIKFVALDFSLSTLNVYTL